MSHEPRRLVGSMVSYLRSEIRCLEPFADDVDHLGPAISQDVVTCLVGTDHHGLRNIDDERAEGFLVCLAGRDKKDREARLA
jgi:hypothetical protein